MTNNPHAKGGKTKCGCGKNLKTPQGLLDHQKAMNHDDDTKPRRAPKRRAFDPETDPDWSGQCSNCGQSPIVPVTGLCGPCTFGEADTAAGNW